MKSELRIVTKCNKIAERYRVIHSFLSIFTQVGHILFIIYGIWLWIYSANQGNKYQKRKSALVILLSVLFCSSFSFIIGKIWKRKRPFAKDDKISNFTGHKSNASFPSNHTMNSFAVIFQLYKDKIPGRFFMTVLSKLLAFYRVFKGLHYTNDLIGGISIAGSMHMFINRSPIMNFVQQLTVWSSLLTDSVLYFIKKAW